MYIHSGCHSILNPYSIRVFSGAELYPDLTRNKERGTPAVRDGHFNNQETTFGRYYQLTWNANSWSPYARYAPTVNEVQTPGG